MEGGREGIAGCAVYADVDGVQCMLVCMERVCYVVGGCDVVATEYGRYSFSCMQQP